MTGSPTSCHRFRKGTTVSSARARAHLRSADAPWREREAGHRDRSIEGAGARSDDIFETEIVSTDIPGHTATGKGNRRDYDQRGHHSHG